MLLSKKTYLCHKNKLLYSHENRISTFPDIGFLSSFPKRDVPPQNQRLRLGTIRVLWSQASNSISGTKGRTKVVARVSRAIRTIICRIKSSHLQNAPLNGFEAFQTIFFLVLYRGNQIFVVLLFREHLNLYFESKTGQFYRCNCARG